MSKFGLLQLVENAENAPDDSTGGGSGGSGGGSSGSTDIPIRFGDMLQWCVGAGGMFQIKNTRIDGVQTEIRIKLANVILKIDRELHLVTPEGVVIFFRISCVLATGDKLNAVDIEATEFNSIRDWTMKHYGTRINIQPGYQRDKNLAGCIHEYSTLEGPVPIEVIYRSTGWHKIGDEMAFTSCSGILTKDGLNTQGQVDLSGDGSILNNYALQTPLSGAELIEAVNLMLSILNVCPAKPHVGAVLLGFAFRALFNSISRSDFGLALFGTTGGGKSTLAGIVLSLFGSFDGGTMPSRFGDSAMATGVKLLMTKDVVHVIDEFTFTGNTKADAELRLFADSIVRNYISNGGRDTLKPGRELRSFGMVRASVLITGEHPLEGPAIIGRVPHIEIQRGDMDVARSRDLVRHAPKLCGAMAALIQQVAANYDDIKSDFSSSVLHYRDKAKDGKIFTSHERAPHNYANILYGSEVALNLLQELGALTAERYTEVLDAIESGLIVVFSEQSTYQSENDPIDRFFEMIRAALSGGMAHIADSRFQKEPKIRPRSFGWSLVGGEQYENHGTLIGWHQPPIGGQDAKIFLEPKNALSVAQNMAQKLRQADFSGAESSLWRQMMQRNLLAEVDESEAKPRPLKKKTIGGTSRRLLVIDSDFLIPPGKDPADEAAAQ
ncbi:hypothetical protein GO003_002765 [Methylicorpusculum oleiharenae]|uniref:hypothetical protein n=1 Tax=Methylicorpusculum oleiharenae TaxID=1338687 RepID=UPI001E649577|nr:hypothetical protein [Methylicorpusculum oleiharenae]MCD2449310.1 hypothetical protein [Methylicorpusculum oleiharenae]